MPYVAKFFTQKLVSLNGGMNTEKTPKKTLHWPHTHVHTVCMIALLLDVKNTKASSVLPQSEWNVNEMHTMNE
tara:strand:- start:7 stop:225 length:219 start_codon:yes stop_codon:yes gene_type:complete